MFENDINLLYSKENYFLILKLNQTKAARVTGDDIELHQLDPVEEFTQTTHTHTHTDKIMHVSSQVCMFPNLCPNPSLPPFQ